MSKLTCPRCGTTFQLDIRGEQRYECPNCKTDILIDRQSILEELAEDIKNKDYTTAREKAEGLYHISDSNAVDTLIFSAKSLESNYKEMKKKFKVTLLLILLITVAAMAAVMLLSSFKAIAFGSNTILISLAALCLVILLLMLRYVICTKKQRAAIKKAENECNSNITVLLQKMRLTVNG